MRWLSLVWMLTIFAACGDSESDEQWKGSESTGMDLSDWDDTGETNPPPGLNLQGSNAALASAPNGHGAMAVRLQSHCSYSYHIVIKDPSGKKAYDTWIDKNSWIDLRVVPGSQFLFCGQLNECPSKAFYTAPRQPTGKGPIHVLTPCS